MRHSHQRALRAQVNFLRRQFLQDGDLPFTDVLTQGVIERALATLTGWLDRIFAVKIRHAARDRRTQGGGAQEAGVARATDRALGDDGRAAPGGPVLRGPV